MLSAQQAIDEAQKLLRFRRLECQRLEVIKRWSSWSQNMPDAPRGATRELRALLKLSRTPWLMLVTTTMTQALFVDGYRSPQGKELTEGPWKTWNANDFPLRQSAIHRAAIQYGYAFNVVLPGTDADGNALSVMRGKSPFRMFAAYEDPAEDDWPVYAVDVQGKRVKLYDDECIYELHGDEDNLRFIDAKGHEAGVCPVVRYTNILDLDGNCIGEVEPGIDMAARINKTVYDRLMVQHFNSWKVRTASGMADFASNEEEANLKKLRLRQQDFLVAEDPDTKFGTLDETSMEGFLKAATADIETMAAVTQTPTHNLTGQMVNLSAEAITAARAPFTQKIFERQMSFAKSHSQALRLDAQFRNDDDAAQDFGARVTWQDLEIRSLSQAMDALGKGATQLKIPAPALWAKIPNVTKDDIQEWSQMILDADPLTMYLASLDTVGGGGNAA
ncbi:hypothetical protein ROP_40340 [Rhodococcus opacus B4]|uniref:Phage portal protein n=2 Tax=Rhodococcus opacus TaxID=37919 RepID=C1B9C8_RHOOB|nr:hypothetical protein ROP_40340 [Rhodococcus opacus B4]